MATIQELFSKNGKIRNIVFIIAFSFFILIVSTYILMGHRFLYTAPLLVLIMLSGLSLKPPKYYLSFCIGSLLSFGLFQATMGFLIFGPVFPAFFDLVIGIIGYILLLTSIWQAIFGLWKMSRAGEIILNIILALGFLLIVFAIVKIEMHGIKVEETPQHETY